MENPATEDANATSADSDKIDWEFDFDEQHCYYDADDLLNHATPAIRTLAEGDGLFADGASTYEWSQFADKLERLAGSLDETECAAHWKVVADIRAELHDECDCSTFEYEHFKESVQSHLDHLASTAGEVLFVVYEEESDDDPEAKCPPVLVESAVDFADLLKVVDKTSRGHDGVRYTYDPATGIGTFNTSDRGYGRAAEFWVITDSDITETYRRIEDCPALDGTEETRDPRLLDGVDLNDDVFEFIETVYEAENVTADLTWWGQKPTAYAVNQLDGRDILALYKKLGVFGCTPEELEALATLLTSASGRIEDLIPGFIATR